MASKRALITGITGQDGVYLTQLLLEKGYYVDGLTQPNAHDDTQNLRSFTDNIEDGRLKLHYGDLLDGGALTRLIAETKPDEIYNLAAQSHVGKSFDTPEYTANTDALGTLRILEAIRFHKLEKKTKFYQAGTSEMFGKVQSIPQNENTPFYPRSPYAVAKLYAYWVAINYREAYGIYAANGILFNHESPVRGETFVTRKISRAVAAIHTGKEKTLYLGNLDAKRDWGHAKDFVKGMWLILQQDLPGDYVLATGENHSVREFVELAFKNVGRSIDWQGNGINEQGIDRASSEVVVKIDPRYYRPTEVDTLLGDPSKAKKELDWECAISFEDLVSEMVQEDIKLSEN